MKDIMQYGKARGMALVSQYLPEINPFTRINVVSSFRDWEEIRSQYDDKMVQRFDYPLGRRCVRTNALPVTSGLAKSVPDYIISAKRQGIYGAVTLAMTKRPLPPRYMNAGGFNVLFVLDQSVTIELVGPGFDGHELTQGKACHERYELSWTEAPFVATRADLVRVHALKYLVTPDTYGKQRRARIKLLADGSVHGSVQALQRRIPEQIILVDEAAIASLLHQVVFRLLMARNALAVAGLSQFAIQGNIVWASGQPKIQPWEIFVPERWS